MSPRQEPGPDERPGDEDGLDELYAAVPGAEEADAAERLTDNQVKGLLEHKLGARPVDQEDTER